MRNEQERIKQTGYYGAMRLNIADPLKVILGGRIASWKQTGYAWGATSDTSGETSQAARAYALLSNMCRRAEDMREREKFKPFDSPAMTRVLEVCSSVYTLKKGEVLVEARANDSLFLVRTGEVRAPPPPTRGRS